VAAYDSAALAALVTHVGEAIDRFREGELDAFEVDHILFHYFRAAKELWTFCNMTNVESTAELVHEQPLIDWWERGHPRNGERRIPPSRNRACSVCSHRTSRQSYRRHSQSRIADPFHGARVLPAWRMSRDLAASSGTMRCMNVEEQPTSDQATCAGLVIKRAEEADWEHVKRVRLAALAESPSVFGSTLAEERQYDETDWRDWCRDTATFLAFQGDIPIGIAAGASGTGRDERRLVAMWLDPGYRGAGASTLLLTAVQDSALHDGATTLMLWVTRGNRAAARLYRRAGFSETGACKPLPSNPPLVEDQLTLDLHRRRRPARARFLEEAESQAVLARYKAAHPVAWRQLQSAMEHTLGHAVENLPMVELGLL
jgi:GNAT superfamily N-acetyltransferase